MKSADLSHSGDRSILQGSVVPFHEVRSTLAPPKDGASVLSPVRASAEHSFMNLNKSLRLEDRPEFAYSMGVGGGSMALWQQRPGMQKPLTPRTRKKLIKEARIKAAADELRRIEEAEAARRLAEERRRWEKEMERIRLQVFGCWCSRLLIIARAQARSHAHAHALPVAFPMYNYY